MAEAFAHVTFAEFLAGEQRSEQRHEFVGGRVYAQAGATERHDLAATLLFRELSAGALAAGCRPFTANRLVHTRNGSAYYPDIMVACGKAPDPLYETDPTLVVEILSPSTAAFDRREKATAYAAAGSLGMLLLVDPDNRRIEAASGEDGTLRWRAYGPGDVIFTPYGNIGVDDFYDTLDAIATT
jgi:Uma2 family endonuclease